MKEDDNRFLQIWGLPPARLNMEQAATVMGFQTHDIPVLVNAGLLKPLGDPQPNSIRYFAAAELRELLNDRKWMSKATNTVYGHWAERNRRRASRKSADAKLRE